MSQLIINNLAEFKQYVGKDLGQSEILKITQEQINQFADATLDHQWIHTDPERAKEGPFGTTIAHGYLSLSLVPYLWAQILKVNNLKMMINYGIERLRFSQPVKVDDEVVLKAHLEAVTDLRGITKAEVGARMEVIGEKKPVFTATLILLYHFE
ncbi:MAG: MaoC family dehydratase [Cyclobacteriaceae bacterium]|nr:MaoC family dehydratase [Cyclobacteriaceae bacterium SS2]